MLADIFDLYPLDPSLACNSYTPGVPARVISMNLKRNLSSIFHLSHFPPLPTQGEKVVAAVIVAAS
eukprot:scaffold19864_cov153-Skeletonema_marinoi.AAC.2